MTLTRIAAATENPVTVEELVLHARIDGTSDQQDVADKISAAVEYVETTELRGRALITSQWELKLEHWPGQCTELDWYGFHRDYRNGYIEIPLGNLQSVGTITYRQSDGTVTTWPSTEYRLERLYAATDGTTDKGIGRVYLAYGKSWPAETLDVGEPITIPFTCGWKDAASVPVSLKLAIEMLTAHWYRNREAVTVGSRVAPGGSHESAPMISTELAVSVQSLCSRYVDRR